MKILIAKLNATGDVVRTTTLLHRLQGEVTWVTAHNNTTLFRNFDKEVQCVTWDSDELDRLRTQTFDLVIALEDDPEVGRFVSQLRSRQIFGAFLGETGRMQYTDDSKAWFDLSIISVHGRETADKLKYQNRRSYQELIFEGLGLRFNGEKYILPAATPTGLRGDVAIAPVAGPVWPMKNWAYYSELKLLLEAEGYKVNMLPRRSTLTEHIGDIRGHRCLVGGDSLPMHLALGIDIPCVTIFNCTSPWEIYDYGIQTQIVSPLLGEFFYKRTFDTRATTAIPVDDVLLSVKKYLK